MAPHRRSEDSLSSVSTTSLVFERIDEREKFLDNPSNLDDDDPLRDDDSQHHNYAYAHQGGRGLSRIGMDRKLKRILLIAAGLFAAIWCVGLFSFIYSKSYEHASHKEHDPAATASRGSAKKVTLDDVMTGGWRAKAHGISWIEGADGEDGLLLEKGNPGKDYLVVEDVRTLDEEHVSSGGTIMASQTLMQSSKPEYQGEKLTPAEVWPSPDLKKVLFCTSMASVWRHSFTAIYWILDVETQTVQPLDPSRPDLRVQLAQWSPQSDAVSFTSENNLHIRRLESESVTQVTDDGGPEYFYGIPDWVYEEEVFEGNSATWWSDSGKYIAFLRTNETLVPEYPIQFFVSRPSGSQPAPGEENYPEVQQLKYPKAGSANPFVDLLFYDIAKGDYFEVEISGSFAADNLLITDLAWAGDQVLVKESNRVSDIMRVVLVDVVDRTGKTVRSVNVEELDGGWLEVTHDMTYIPADPENGRSDDGYIDTVIHEGRDHIAYFSPLDTDTPVMVTSGQWEVDGGPAAVDLKNSLVYFVATKESSIQRHVYSAKLDGSELKAITDTSSEAYYDVSFSSNAGYALMSYKGPGIPTQKVISTPSNTDSYEYVIEKNSELSEKARKYALPLLNYGTLEVEGFQLNYVERRPPHFNPKKKYPVLFQQYSGPGSQSVTKQFSVDFQSYIASSLGYIVVTVDGRGTGFIGREARVLVRKHLGQYEAQDQITAAKTWAAKPYVDASRIAIWGWSYGGFQTLKTLEADAGETFSYGMAVAPVTDWRFYDSVYTERYMLTPQDNPDGYDGTAVSNVTALGSNVRFLIMHGVADDNVHMQNTLTLLDKLDIKGVENYDLHMFPDSNHGIYFHNANRIVYDKLNNWLINAFNGEWLKIADAKPLPIGEKKKRDVTATATTTTTFDMETFQREGLTISGGGGGEKKPSEILSSGMMV